MEPRHHLEVALPPAALEDLMHARVELLLRPDPLAHDDLLGLLVAPLGRPAMRPKARVLRLASHAGGEGRRCPKAGWVQVGGRGRRRWLARKSSACIAPCSSDFPCGREAREAQGHGAFPACRCVAGTHADVRLLRIGAARPRIRSAAIRGEPSADKRCLGRVRTRQAACLGLIRNARWLGS